MRIRRLLLLRCRRWMAAVVVVALLLASTTTPSRFATATTTGSATTDASSTGPRRRIVQSALRRRQRRVLKEENYSAENPPPPLVLGTTMSDDEEQEEDHDPIQSDNVNDKWIVRFHQQDDNDSNSNERARLIQKLVDFGGQLRFFNTLLPDAVAVAGLRKETIDTILSDNDNKNGGIDDNESREGSPVTATVEIDAPVYALKVEKQELDENEDEDLWNLDRIDETDVSDLDDTYRYKYTGDGVDVYLFDTGIQSNHREFQDRVTCGVNYIDDEDCEDYKSHGTHVAGTIAGKTYGVAKDANLITVKVLDRDGNGNASKVIAGLQYCVDEKQNNPDRPMVVNLSLGSSFSDMLNNAVNDAVAAGLVVIVASGNEGVDACTKSPSSAESGITVGATTVEDILPPWSNYGDCVDIYAPGAGILSAMAHDTDRKMTVVKSGTSMAAPHVAGLAAMYLEWNPTLTPAQVSNYILSDAISDIIYETDIPKRMIYTEGLLGRSGTPDPPPTPLPSNSPTPQPVVPNGPEPTPSPEVASTPTFTPTELSTLKDAVSEPACGMLVLSSCEKDEDCCWPACTWFGDMFGHRCWLW